MSDRSELDELRRAHMEQLARLRECLRVKQVIQRGAKYDVALQIIDTYEHSSGGVVVIVGGQKEK